MGTNACTTIAGAGLRAEEADVCCAELSKEATWAFLRNSALQTESSAASSGVIGIEWLQAASSSLSLPTRQKMYCLLIQLDQHRRCWGRGISFVVIRFPHPSLCRKYPKNFAILFFG